MMLLPTPDSKPLRLLTAALALVAGTTACSKDQPQPEPVADFTVSRERVEPNEPVGLTNTSQGATHYRWWCNGQEYTSQDLTLAFPQPGLYRVELSAYNGKARPGYQTFRITVGHRRIQAVALTHLDALRPNGQPWDADGSGPDLAYFVVPRGQAVSPGPFEPLRDVVPNAPARLPLALDRLHGQWLRPGQEFDIVLYDYDYSPDRNDFGEEMGRFSLRTDDPTATRDAQSRGVYTLRGGPTGQWQATVSYATEID